MTNTEFQKLIGVITPDTIGKYLKKENWVEDGQISNQAIIWHRKEEEFYENEVIQPTDVKVRSYSQRVKEAVGAIAEFEKRDVSKIVDDMINFHSDLVKVRVVHPDVEGGTIPLEDGVLLIERSRDLLIASTLSTFKKQSVFSGSRPQDVQDFLGRLKLGQTEVGSFVVNLISPIEVHTEAQCDGSESSITRSVTTNLARSLTAITEAIEKYSGSRNIFDFEKIVGRGVSANLCDALIGLSGRSRARSFSIVIKTGGAEPGTLNFSENYDFSPQSVPFLEDASEYLKGRYTVKNFNAVGLVSVLKHLPNDEFGQVTVKALVKGKITSITIQLPLEDYWQAFEAHKSGSEVSCVGTLNVSPRSAQLLEPSDFKTIKPQDDFFNRQT